MHQKHHWELHCRLKDLPLAAGIHNRLAETWQVNGDECSIPPILFTATSEIILRTVSRRVCNSAGQWLPTLRCFMYNVISLRQTALLSPQEARGIALMIKIKIKPAKALSICKGSWVDSVSFQVARERILVLVEQPISSGRRIHSCAYRQARGSHPSQTNSKRHWRGLTKATFQVWCFQFPL